MGRRTVDIKSCRVLILLPLFLLLLIALWAIKDYGTNTAYLTEDTDHNGLKEIYILEDHSVTITEDSNSLWHSPEAWNIKQILLADADHDGQKELLMVVWKNGSFGASKPMWMKAEDNEYTCHLFVYRLAVGKIKPVWCSSALERPIRNLKITDMDNDGLLELQVRESLTKTTTWQWQDWGFYQK